jgi:hypothetical protein
MVPFAFGSHDRHISRVFTIKTGRTSLPWLNCLVVSYLAQTQLPIPVILNQSIVAKGRDR